MWKVLARTLKDELDAVRLGLEDEPMRCVEDNDTLMLYGSEVPLFMKKVYALWKRNAKEREWLEPLVAELEKRYPTFSVAERNDAYKKSNALITVRWKELLWHGMWCHVIEHKFPGHARYYVEFCRGWQLVLVGEPER